jgi:selenocysteine lyase/cysteine desulfurase
LQGTVMKAKLFGGRSTATGASRYEISTASHLGCVCQHQALQYIQSLGIERIRAHARPLVARLMKELPAAGYPTLTPPGTESPIASFQVKDVPLTREKLKKANVVVTLSGTTADGQMRVSVSVFNNQGDVNRLVGALA